MLTFSDDEVKAQIEADTGIRPPFALESFGDLEADVRQPIARMQASPFLHHKNVRGFVYDGDGQARRGDLIPTVSGRPSARASPLNRVDFFFDPG